MTKTIKQQFDEVNQIIEWFNNVDDFEIETATVKYQQAKQLLAEIKKQLDQQQNQIDKLETKS